MKHHRISRLYLALLVATASALAACRANVPAGGTILGTVRSDKPRLSPSLDNA